MIYESSLTQQSIKAIHLKEIYLKALHYNGISRAQLKRELDLSFPSISSLVEELLSHHILFEVGVEEKNQRGRPQTILQVNPNALTIPVARMCAYGYQCVLYNCRGDRISETFFPYESDPTKTISADGQWHPDTATLLDPLKEWLASLSGYRLSDFVLCISGNFDDKEVMTSSAIYLTTPPHFLTDLKEVIGKESLILNDADCCAFAEKKLQNLPNDFIFIQVNEGVGAGIIRNGRIFQKDILRAGEIGHMSIDYQGKPCVCGGKGCLERYISIPEIMKEVHQQIDAKLLSFHQICEAYHNNDPAITHLIHQKAELLAVGISNTLAMQPVQHIVLGGEITKLGEPFLKTVRNIMKERGLRRYLDRVTITYSSGSNQELTGALWNYIEHQLTIDHLIDPQIKFIRNEVT